jgi:hypothetical protein
VGYTMRMGLAAVIAFGCGQAAAQSTPVPAANPGQIAAPNVAKARGPVSHSKNRKPRHRVQAPGQAAAPSVAEDKGPSGAQSGSTAPANAAGAPAEAAAPSVAHNR